MGWEVRPNGRRYLYRNHRVNGKPVKEYLSADDPIGFGSMMADDLRRVQKREAKVRRLTREIAASYRKRIADLLAATAAANEPLRVVADALLTVAGYRKHHRGEWRMNRTLNNLAKRIAKLKAEMDTPKPLVTYQAPKDDAEAVEVYAKARTGDEEAGKRVGELIRQRGWVDWVGDLGRLATRNLIAQATCDDEVWRAGIEEKVKAMNEELLGPNPSILERLLVRRIVNGWVTVHALELEAAIRPPANLRNKAYLETAIGRAQKRMTQAIGELARLRRLQAPVIIARMMMPATAAGDTTQRTPPALS